MLSQTNKPIYRRLRGYALDPSYSSSVATATVNHVVYKVYWEEAPVLKPGPIGEYVEVVNVDLQGRQVCPPLDLDDPYILAQDGLAPSEENFKFHQQMVYAVAMTTIMNFEKGLGRFIQWCQDDKTPPAFLRKMESPSTRKKQAEQTNKQTPDYVRTLKLYWHAEEIPNAYFLSEKNALMFGYFHSMPADVTIQMPNAMVYACLSHDIIAHETTHAIINGLYSSYKWGSNPDTEAFNEAFADMMALFQHFSFPELMKSQIAKTRGDLNTQNFLFEIGRQFGTALGQYNSLRNAIGGIDEKTKEWKPRKPNPEDYKKVKEPHRRGEILVSIIFDAFKTIYQNRIADLIRIASGGSGILQQGELHPELVNRLSEEASSTAMHVMRMCIRALDYCPPSDITFGDFLRALVTIDMDLVEDDTNGYRLAIMEAYRKWGIYPSEIVGLSEESLRYPLLDEEADINELLMDIVLFLREYRKKIIITKSREDVYKITQTYINGLYERIIKNKEFRNSHLLAMYTGLVFNDNAKHLGIEDFERFGISCPSFEIRSLHLASRVTNEGKRSNQIVISILQKAKIYSTPKRKTEPLELTGGCTLLFDLDSLALRYAISKPLLDLKALQANKYQINAERVKEVRDYNKNSDKWRTQG